MKSLHEYTAMAEDGLKQLSLRDDEYPMLYGPVRYTLDGGGKRLRPVITLMGCDAYGTDCEKALKAALGVEMFHNFTLLHDDVMDKSPLRRGRTTVHCRWDENTAILSGDAMLTLATELVEEVDDNCLRRVLATFNRGALAVYEGQALDMEFENSGDPVEMQDYLKMISLKTGALLGCAVKIGAIVGGADEKSAEALYRYGMELGVAFQIHDDYLDMYGDASSFGKPIGGDVENNKQTFLLLSALEHGGEKSACLRKAMTSYKGEEKLRIFREIYDSLGIAEQCRVATEKYCNNAIAHLQEANISAEAEVAFAAVANRLTDRVK